MGVWECGSQDQKLEKMKTLKASKSNSILPYSHTLILYAYSIFLYTKLIITFFCSVEIILSSYFLSPSFTTSREVLGGISPRFSATITN